MDRIEQCHRILRLVRLATGPMRCTSTTGVSAASAGHFFSRFLDAVLAEQALARGDDGTDVGGLEGLRHRDELDLGARPARGIASFGYQLLNGGEPRW